MNAKQILLIVSLSSSALFLSITGYLVYRTIQKIPQMASEFEKREGNQKKEQRYGKDEGLSTTGGNPFRGDPRALEEGHLAFDSHCAACHNRDARGLIGPDLTDSIWLHGGSEDEIFHTISEGVSMDQVKQVPPKGPCPPWKDSLSIRTRWQILSYLQSLNPRISPSAP